MKYKRVVTLLGLTIEEVENNLGLNELFSNGVYYSKFDDSVLTIEMKLARFNYKNYKRWYISSSGNIHVSRVSGSVLPWEEIPELRLAIVTGEEEDPNLFTRDALREFFRVEAAQMYLFTHLSSLEYRKSRIHYNEIALQYADDSYSEEEVTKLYNAISDRVREEDMTSWVMEDIGMHCLKVNLINLYVEHIPRIREIIQEEKEKICHEANAR